MLHLSRELPVSCTCLLLWKLGILCASPVPMFGLVSCSLLSAPLSLLVLICCLCLSPSPSVAETTHPGRETHEPQLARLPQTQRIKSSICTLGLTGWKKTFVSDACRLTFNKWLIVYESAVTGSGQKHSDHHWWGRKSWPSETAETCTGIINNLAVVIPQHERDNIIHSGSVTHLTSGSQLLKWKAALFLKWPNV